MAKTKQAKPHPPVVNQNGGWDKTMVDAGQGDGWRSQK
jgi:hypothetical protein